jgi:hypothetical protein
MISFIFLSIYFSFLYLLGYFFLDLLVVSFLDLLVLSFLCCIFFRSASV